jgi:hypothetical protein
MQKNQNKFLLNAFNASVLFAFLIKKRNIIFAAPVRNGINRDIFQCINGFRLDFEIHKLPSSSRMISFQVRFFRSI